MQFCAALQFYEGRKPVVCVCDPELIRLILVKESDYFRDRRAVDLGDPQVNEMMDFLPRNDHNNHKCYSKFSEIF